ncbi:uncharacterized protein si:ch211-244b2.3 [Trichomycterus rosablanca]|uniref:uncharacterized protein si:ch211-244b2.3 n=1 Tax=Trichomycterus rosablanca TaxID=2290929 RepID=UPI002F35C613
MAGNTVGKPSEWQLYFGQQWSSIENDHILEANYCQPGAKGITISTHLGELYIDFDAMTVSGPYADFRVQRKVFLSHNQTEDMRWYYKDNYSWCEYGTQGSSVNSQYLEQLYQSNPAGVCNFTVGSYNYTLNFSDMVQTNQSTQMTRKVKRRPNFQSTVISSPVVSPSSLSYIPNLSSASVASWEFLDKEGVWTEYQKPGSSLDSLDIERQYQLNPQNQLTFTAGHYTYTLNFSKMCQINTKFGTKRAVRRNITANQQNSSPVVSPSSLSYIPNLSSASVASWEFLDNEGVWTEYQKPGSSLDSLDIQRQYQLNPQNQLTFTAGHYTYTLNFSKMCQINTKFGTKRAVRRNITANQQNSSAVTQARWQFFDSGWKDFVKGSARGQCTVSSQDIELQYQQNRTGNMSFSSRRFSYTIDFTAMIQTNLTTNTQRNIQRLESP